MRKILVSAIVLFTAFYAKAQVLENTDSNPNQDVIKKHIIKTNVLGYAMKNFNISYEYALTSYFSISASTGYMPQGKLWVMNLIKDKLKSENPSNDLSSLVDVEAGANLITIEPRFYLGQGWGKGFFIAPYYRYTSVNFKNLKITENSIPFNFKGKAYSHNGGILMGAQWFLGQNKNWVIDTFIGGHFGVSYGNANSPLNKFIAQAAGSQIEQKIQNSERFKPFADKDSLRAKVDTEGETPTEGIVRVNLEKGNWIGLRAGIAIGYRF